MLTDDEKIRARMHMGYLNVQQASTFVLGVPAGVQTQFVIEGALQKVIPAAEPLLRTLLTRLDAVDEQIVENMENLAVNKVDEIELREDEFKQLIIRYRHWQGALANLLGVPPNPFDQRPYLAGGQSGGINVSVIS